MITVLWSSLASFVLASGPVSPMSAVAVSPPSSAAVCAADTAITAQQLGAATVKASTRARRSAGTENAMRIGQQELFRAACCNLGESFVTNPSVDVSYDDAATGASQIKLLGLSGRYVQMLTETMPAFRGAAQPFALGYVPGSWMKSINVSKGASSVKNGYESITGQIDIDYLKPDDERAANIDFNIDRDLTVDFSADANLHLNDRLSTNLLVHYNDQYTQPDMEDDGFLEAPNIRQFNVMNRWKFRGDRYIMHAGAHALYERRHGGQTDRVTPPRYAIGVETERAEGYMKHAYIIDPDRLMNVALMANGSYQHLEADYGHADRLFKHYGVRETAVNAQLMFEMQPSERHALSTGISVVHDGFDEDVTASSVAGTGWHDDGETTTDSGTLPTDISETTTGLYAQYTYTPTSRLTLMAGLRGDYSSRYGAFVTPRVHLKWQPADIFTLRASGGKGYRSPHVMAEHHFLLASGKTLHIAEPRQEEAWNTGASGAFVIPVGSRVLRLNAEYYYTHFLQQTIVDYEVSPGIIVVHNLKGDNSNGDNGRPRSFSHVVQFDAQYEPIRGLDVTAAYRHNIVRTTYGGRLRDQILTPRFKAMLSLSYKTPLELWQFDATLALNGPGRLPDGTRHSLNDYYQRIGLTRRLASDTFGAMENVSVQVTRRFRHIDVYLGADNLTDRCQTYAIIDADRPWGPAFEPTLVYGSVNGRMFYAGFRLKL